MCINELWWEGVKWIHLAQQLQGPVVGFSEHDNEPLRSIKGETFLEQLSDYQLLKNETVLWNQVSISCEEYE